MTANPIDLVGGLDTTGNVSKADLVAWAKARVPTVMASVSEVRSTILAAQIVFLLKTTGAAYYLDTTDTTTADDGITCIISADGFRFKIETGVLTPSLTSLGGVFAKTPVAHQFVTGLDTSGNLLIARPALADLSDGISVDTDGTLAANSDLHIASQKAVKTFVATALTSVTLTNMIRPEDFGAKGDGIVYASGMAISSGSHNLAISGYTPVGGDVGKYVAIDGAGASGACLVSTVSSISGSNLVLAAAASTTVTTAAGEIGTDDSAALHNMSAACTGKAIWFGAGKTYFHTDDVSNTKILLFATGPFVIYGNEATVKSMASAPSATFGFVFADSTFTHNGPANFKVYDTIYDGNMARRVSSGAISNAVGSEVGFECFGCQYFKFYNCIARGTTADGFYLGGDSGTGRASQFFGLYGCLAEKVGRNGYSIVGASYGNFTGCIAQNITFGAAHSNISTGWDHEPNGASTSNSNITLGQCTASNCTNVGYNSTAGGGSNSAIVIGNCRAEACGIGVATDDATGTKAFAISVAGNTTNFSGLSEKISGF